MSEKVQSTHTNRAAYVYVRQSTMHQVRCNHESRQRQYSLKARALELGFHDVVVIDEDLGISGSGSKERPGFGRLLAAVCEGVVGGILALEASRLARNNRDWHHLLDLCMMTETLVIDHDGIYDPRLMNDRLLLGLKGTMSEFELGLLRQRALEALKQKIHRGEVLTEVPIGYVRTESNTVEITPDRQVSEAIHSVFRLFRKFGSARQVLLWYRQEQVPLCTHERNDGKLAVVWRLPIYNRIVSILKNPIYAGAFAYGRTCTRTDVVDGRARRSSGHSVVQDNWEVLIRDHHPGYITWEEYVSHQKQLASNLAKHHAATPGPAKRGPALLAGMLRCGRCGRKLHVAYGGLGGRVQRYHCRGANVNHGGEVCISFGGLRVDQAVANVVLDAIQPAGVAASLEAWQTASEEKGEKRKALELTVQKAKYEAERARRQYDTVEPENRLVAAELEARWNLTLEYLTEVEAQLEREDSNQETVSEHERERLMELGKDLPALWEHPDASVQIKKRILRTVIEEIIVDVDGDRSAIVLCFHWAGGVHTRMTINKNKTGSHGRSTDRSAVDLVMDLAKVCPDGAIANIMNRLGYRTGADNTWTEARITSLRSYQKIPVFDRRDGRLWMTLQDAAQQLGVSPNAVRSLIAKKALPARQVVPYSPWIIERKDLESQAVRSAIAAVKKGRGCPRTDEGQDVMAFLSTT